MKTLRLKADLINNKIQIFYGFEVDYSHNLKTVNINNNGVGGKIINVGELVHEVTFNPNLHHLELGQSDYDMNLSFMKRQLSVYQSLQPNQIRNIINN